MAQNHHRLPILEVKLASSGIGQVSYEDFSSKGRVLLNKYEYVKKSVCKRREWLDSLKDSPCSDCGIKYPPFVMEWHHLNPCMKSFSIGQGSFRHSRGKILFEISKCVLLCSNCHRIREYA